MIIDFTKNFARFPALLFSGAPFPRIIKYSTGETYPFALDTPTPSDPVQNGVFSYTMNHSSLFKFIPKALTDTEIILCQLLNFCNRSVAGMDANKHPIY